MTIHFYERIILTLGAVILVGFLGGIFYGLAAQHVEVADPGAAGRIDPRTMLDEPPFNQPGLVQTAPMHYQAVIVANGRSWQFQPNVIEIPTGATVEFLIASPDVIHGFRMLGTNLNVMVIPGHVARVRHTFDSPGEYVYVCHEYCGIGHQGMFGRLIVGEEVSG